VRGPLAGSRRYLRCVRDDPRSKNVFHGRSSVKRAGRRAETELEGAKKGHRRGRKERRERNAARRSIARWLVYLPPARGCSRSDGMFINRLIWKIGGWFRVVAGHGSSIAIKHKSIISTRPLRARARARARRPCIPSVCTSSRRHAHTRSRPHAHLFARPIDRAFFH